MHKVLLVRPKNRLAADQEICQDLGWEAVPFAVMGVVPDMVALAALPEILRQVDAVFWVSPSAVEIAVEVYSLPKICVNIPNITVGKASAEALHAAGLSEVYYPQHGNDSEAVAMLPVWDVLPSYAHVLIVRGNGGRDWLAKYLQKRGFNIQFAEIYHRHHLMPDWDLYQTEQPDCAWVTSGQLVRNIFDNVPPELAQNLKSLLYLTHHERIATMLSEYGAAHICIAHDLKHALLCAHKCLG